jgi:hypothetical protein
MVAEKVPDTGAPGSIEALSKWTSPSPTTDTDNDGLQLRDVHQERGG